jgi:serine/threonine-protein kinase
MDVAALFDEALQQRPEDREGWIERVCAKDTAVADELRALLRADAQSSGILERPFHVIADKLGLAVQDENALRIGTLLGPYRLKALLGSGGMGRVYRAERDDGAFAQTVALKLIRSEKLTDFAHARFLLERRILARLSHPHIAHLIDGGINESGEPWFAMEYVDGQPLLAWCDARSLNVRARLLLMLDICAAIEFAHARLIIHRDIKPANVLVDHRGAAKVLDFGIAKLLSDEEDGALATAMQTRLLTPEYAAPEQIRGEAITTATDVHALGLLLYELLCGQRAYGFGGQSSFDVQRDMLDRDAQTMTERIAQVATEDAEQANRLALQRQRDVPALRRELRGDLQHVVDKALRKQPEERYPNVTGLADDIRRYLAAEPVIAAGGARWYRLRKFVQRWRGAVISAALIATVVIVGIIAVGVESHRANQAAARAESEAQTANSVRDFLVDVFNAADPQNALGKPPNALELLDSGARRIEGELASQPRLQAQLFDAVGTIYSNLGQYSSAIAMLRKGRAALTQTADGASSALADQLDFDQSSVVGKALPGVTATQAKALREEARPLLDALIAKQRTLPPDSRALFVKALVTRSQLEKNVGDAAASEATLREAIAQARAQGRAGELDLAAALLVLGNVLIDTHRNIDALACDREAVAIYLRRLDSRNPLLTQAQGELANNLSETGAAGEAIELMRRVTQVQRDVLGETHPAYAASLVRLGDILVRNDEFTAAEPLFVQALQVAESVGGKDSDAVAGICNSFAVMKLRQGDTAASRAYEQRALAIWMANHGPNYSQVLIEQHNLATLEYEDGNYVQARALFLDLDERRRQAGLQPYRQELRSLGRIERMLGHPEKARTLFDEAMARQNAIQSGELSQTSLMVELDLARVERDLGNLDAARTYATAALAGLLRTLPVTHSFIGDARYTLAQLDYLQGRCANSAADFQLQAQRYDQMRGPSARWHRAEAGLLIGLCRRQINPTDAAASATIIANARELLESTRADPFFQRLAQQSLLQR